MQRPCVTRVNTCNTSIVHESIDLSRPKLWPTLKCETPCEVFFLLTISIGPIAGNATAKIKILYPCPSYHVCNHVTPTGVEGQGSRQVKESRGTNCADKFFFQTWPSWSSLCQRSVILDVRGDRVVRKRGALEKDWKPDESYGGSLLWNYFWKNSVLVFQSWLRAKICLKSRMINQLCWMYSMLLGKSTWAWYKHGLYVVVHEVGCGSQYIV